MIRAIKRRINHHGKRIRTRLDHLRAAREAARRNGRGVLELAAENARLLREHGLTRRGLTGFGLDVDRMSFDEKTKYLPTEWDAQLRMWEQFVPEHRRGLYHNKYLFNRFFAAEGLPVAKLFGVLDAAIGRLGNGNSLRTPEDLSRWMRDTSPNGAPDTGFVIKPVEGLKGHGVFVFEKRVEDDDERFLTLDGEPYSGEKLYGITAGNPDLQTLAKKIYTRSFLIEERQVPHALLAALIGPTFCTTRVITFIARDGSPRILAAVMKIMPGRSGLDHSSRGSVVAWIDVDTGRLDYGRRVDSTERVESVPGTDRLFRGIVLPHWASVKEVALQAQSAYPWARSIGWDIGITEGGPVIIEGNTWWSMKTQHIAPCGLLEGEFKAMYEETKTRDG
jgi:hypothetical protein